MPERSDRAESLASAPGTMRRHLAFVIGLTLAATTAAACSSGRDGSNGSASESTRASTTTTATSAVPGAEWEKIAPAAAGIDAAKLDQIAQVAQAGKSKCLVVVRDGKLAGEWYFRGTNEHTTQDVFSMTKSVSSTLVGIAQDDGDLKITDHASTWIPQWNDTPADAVTVRDLLSNDSGRKWSPAIDYVQLLATPDRTAFAIGLPQAEPPGQVWAYNNSAIQTLQPVVQKATGQDVVAFAQQQLFGPLGMTDTRMTTDRVGNAQMFEGVQSTCRDMARFGVLMLNHGKWGDKQIVSAAWVKDATGHSSQKLNAAYGYLWWLNRKGVIGSPLVATDLSKAQNPTTRKGQVVPGAPDDMFWALGLGNQIVQVDPGSKTVVVRLGTAEARPQPPTFGPVEASKVVTEAVTTAAK
jgi:CubicO group peptidase (beta-lactamase class C family)